MSTTIAEPLPYTLLSLPRYAKILGVNPVHFQSAFGSTIFPVSTNTCADLFPRHSWQYNDHVSHEDVARAIYDAEQEIARELGYYPAPYWINEEQHRFSRHHRHDMYQWGGLNVRGQRKSIKAKFGKFIEAGRRAVTLVGTATTAGGTLVYSDEDGDGFAETATITLATTLTNECEIDAYFADESGAQAWQIRPTRSKTITGGNVVLVYDSWLFIDPDTQAAYPTTAGFSGIDISTTANYVTSVDVYREYTDFSQASAVFYWEPKPINLSPLVTCTSCSGTGCAACALSTQDGCIHVRDVEEGIVVPAPGTYDSDNTQWTQASYTVCRDPDMVKIYYLAGEYGDRYLANATCDPLSNFWAHTIAWLATARLDRSPCQCGSVQAFYDRLRTDISYVGETSFQVDLTLLTNPFGTRIGEIMAWQRVHKIVGDQIGAGIW